MLKCDVCNEKAHLGDFFRDRPHEGRGSADCKGTWREVKEEPGEIEKFIAREGAYILKSAEREQVLSQAAIDNYVDSLGRAMRSTVDMDAAKILTSALDRPGLSQQNLDTWRKGATLVTDDTVAVSASKLTADHAELQKLREENVRLKAQNDGLISLASSQTKTCQQLRMELSDAKGAINNAYEFARVCNEELDFAKHELKRHDPRLAKARWGSR